MTERVKKLLETLKNESYRKGRTSEIFIDSNYYEVFPSEDKKTLKFVDVLKYEKPYLIENDRIGFYQYQKEIGQMI